jgi:hypothetical protein
VQECKHFSPGAVVDQVRHVLGHRTEATTRLYLRRDPVGLAAAMEGRRYLAAS